MVACLSLAVPAQAQTVLLDATMTVGQSQAINSLGYESSSLESYGALSDATFSSGGNAYTIDELTLWGSNVYLSVGEEISGIDDLTLTFDDKTFDGSAFTYSAELKYYSQGSQGLSLTNGETGVTVKITAPATADLEFDPASVTVGENGGTATYKVKLATQPTHDVEVAVTSGDTKAATVSPTSVTLTSMTWSDGATVTVTGVDDSVSNPGSKRTVTLSHSATSMDGDYNNKTGNVSVDVTDVPAAPTDLTAVPDTGAGTLEVSWTDAVGATAHFYKYGTTSGAGTWKPTSNPRRIDNLTPGETYHVQVRGWNTAGDGPHAEVVGVASGDFPAPTGLSVTAGDGQLEVMWTAISGAISYEIRHGATSPTGTWTSTTSTSYTIPNLTNGTTYYVQVRGKKSATNLGTHAEITGTPVAVPAAPTNLTAVPGTGAGHLEVSWTGESGVNYYYRYGTTSPTGTGGWALTSNPRVIGSLTPGATYYVQVQGRNSSGDGPHAEVAGVASGGFPAPTGLSVTAGDGQLALTWTPDAQATSHEIRHGTTSGAGTWTATTTNTSHTITGLDNGTTYYVQVRGKKSATNLGTHAEITGTPAASGTVPGQVMNLALAAGNEQLSATWDVPTGTVTGYDVEYSTDGTNWSDAGHTGTDASHTIGSLTNGTAYDVRVRAKNGSANGNWSAEMSATPVAGNSPPAFSGPTTVNFAENGTGTVLTAQASDPDAQDTTVTFSIGTSAGDNVWFTITDAGVLTWDTDIASYTPNFEDPRDGTDEGDQQGDRDNDYKVTVTATSGSGAREMMATRTYTVTVTDVAEPPAAPDAPTATAGDKSISLTWTAPENTGPAISGYGVEYTESGTESWMDAGHTGTDASHSITGLDNGTAYEVQVRAKNDEGEGGWSASATATPQGPGAGPQGLQFWEGDEELVAFWTAAQVGRYEMDWGTGWKQVSWGGASGYTIDGLTNGTEYTVMLRACEGNACGTPAIGKGTPTANPKPYGVPDVTVSAAGSGELALTWTAAEHATGYEFRYGKRRWGLGASWEDVGNVTTHTITGLDNWTEYMVEVRGVNAEGHGWAALGFGTPEAEGLHAPGHLTATGGNMKLKVTWGAVDAASGHEICHSAAADDCSGGGWTATAGSSAHTVTGLTNGTMHYVWVRGVDGTTKGPASEASGTPVAATEPPETPWLNAPDPGDGQVTVDWDPSQGGAEVEAYEVAVAVQGKGWSSCPSDTKPMCPGPTEAAGGGDAREHAVTGLSNRKQYAFRVRAKNAAGESEWSATRYARPDGSSRKPYQVDRPTATPKDGKVAVSWTAPNNGGSDITGYDIQTAVKGGGWSSCPSTTPMCPDILEEMGTAKDITNLTNGTHYAFRVRAKNAQGTGDWSQTAYAEPQSGLMGMSGKVLKQVLSNQARTLLEDATSVIGRRMADNQAGSDTLSAFAGLFGGEGPGGCTLAESIEDCVTRGASGGGGHGFGPGDRDGGWSGSLSDLRGLVKSRGFAVSLNRPLPQAGAPFSQDAPVPDEGMQLTFWGEGAASQSTDALFWGMDASGAGWMTGVAFAESGEGVTGALSRGDARVTGFAQSEVSAVYPYAKGRFGSGLEVWSLAGWGTGHVDSTWTGFASVSGPEEVIRLRGDLGFAMGLFGAEQVLYEQDGLSLSAVGDAGWSQLSVSGGAADGLAASVSRTRFGLEGRYASGDGAWTSALRLGGRVDGGDGETASGAEVSGDVHHRWGRWEAGLQGRWYTAETTGAGFGEQGVRAALGMRAREDGTGLAFALSPGWGTEAGVLEEARLLDTLDRDAGAAAAPALHLDGRVSWGARLGGLFGAGDVLRPYGEFSAGEASRHLRMGLALEGPVTLGLALDRRQGATGPAEHGVMLRLDTRF